jgi:hypothetical protein
MPDRHTPEIESPSANRMQGAAGLPHELDEPATSGDQDIDTAGTEADEQSVATARTDPNRARQDRNVEEPGDTNSADIVGRTGEQMPQQSHDGLESEQRESPSRATDDNVDTVDEAPRTSRAS